MATPGKTCGAIPGTDVYYFLPCFSECPDLNRIWVYGTVCLCCRCSCLRAVPVVPDRAGTSADGTLWYFEGYSCGTAELILFLFFFSSCFQATGSGGGFIVLYVRTFLNHSLCSSSPDAVFCPTILSRRGTQTGGNCRRMVLRSQNAHTHALL